MNTQVPFQYVLLRFTNDIETGEFLNVGLALYSRVARYLRVQILTRYERITNAFPGTDGEFYRSFATHLQNEFDNLSESLLQERLEFDPLPEDLRALLFQVLPSADSALRPSEPKFGVTDDLDALFEHLYARMVERYLKHQEVPSRSDDDVWYAFKRPLVEQKLLAKLPEATVKTKRGSQRFDHTYRNGHLNVLYPQSFDLVRPASIVEKGHKIIGRATVLQESKEQPHLVLLAGTPRSANREIIKAYEDAKGMIQDQGERLSVEIIEEEQAEEFAERVKEEIGAHHENQVSIAK